MFVPLGGMGAPMGGPELSDFIGESLRKKTPGMGMAIGSLIADLAMGMALGVDREHKENCDAHDHTPMGFLRAIADMLDQANEEVPWEEIYAQFDRKMSEKEADKLTKDLPEELNVSDILGEETKD